MPIERDDPRLTAYALGEMSGAERRGFETLLEQDPTAADEVEAIRVTGAQLQRQFKVDQPHALDAQQRQRVLTNQAPGHGKPRRRLVRRLSLRLAASLLFIGMLGGLAYAFIVPHLLRDRLASNVTASGADPARSESLTLAYKTPALMPAPNAPSASTEQVRRQLESLGYVSGDDENARSSVHNVETRRHMTTRQDFHAHDLPAAVSDDRGRYGGGSGRNSMQNVEVGGSIRVRAEYDPEHSVEISASPKRDGYGGGSGGVEFRTSLAVALPGGGGGGYGGSGGYGGGRLRADIERHDYFPQNSYGNTEHYASLADNPFSNVTDQPLSTFAIDVDTASYTNARRFLNDGALPPPDSVRIEEFINYFKYDYPEPAGETPFSVNVEVNACPWNGAHRLARIGLKGKTPVREERPPCNLVFLVDVSGSMKGSDKLPLLKSAMQILLDALDGGDRVGIVTYSDTARVALPSTSCDEKEAIRQVLEQLSAGGSTNGGSGIQEAYAMASHHFDEEGVNRVILATDGDFNVGITVDTELTRLITAQAKSGVFLSVLGFGTGNLKDGNLEMLADKGNGNYAYIDSFAEARRVLLDQAMATLVTIAKDVKIQVEFNPAHVGAYRLIGYENRMLAAQDFNDDTKDAGEIGAGHTVTALYELTLAGGGSGAPGVEPLKYQQRPAPPVSDSDELMTVKLRYKQPDADRSTRLEFPIDAPQVLDRPSQGFQFASAVGLFGMLLRHSPHSGDASFDSVLGLADASRADDPDGRRAEFVSLVRAAKSLRR